MALCPHWAYQFQWKVLSLTLVSVKESGINFLEQNLWPLMCYSTSIPSAASWSLRKDTCWALCILLWDKLVDLQLGFYHKMQIRIFNKGVNCSVKIGENMSFRSTGVSSARASDIPTCQQLLSASSIKKRLNLPRLLGLCSQLHVIPRLLHRSHTGILVWQTNLCCAAIRQTLLQVKLERWSYEPGVSIPQILQPHRQNLGAVLLSDIY